MSNFLKEYLLELPYQWHVQYESFFFMMGSYSVQNIMVQRASSFLRCRQLLRTQRLRNIINIASYKCIRVWPSGLNNRAEVGLLRLHQGEAVSVLCRASKIFIAIYNCKAESQTFIKMLYFIRAMACYSWLPFKACGHPILWKTIE